MSSADVCDPVLCVRRTSLSCEPGSGRCASGTCSVLARNVCTPTSVTSHDCDDMAGASCVSGECVFICGARPGPEPCHPGLFCNANGVKGDDDFEPATWGYCAPASVSPWWPTRSHAHGRRTRGRCSAQRRIEPVDPCRYGG